MKKPILNQRPLSGISQRVRCNLLAGLGLLLATSGLGCRGNAWFRPPGPINQQRADAVVYDPYPTPDIAPNDLGSRPPGYERPLPEPVRNRLYKDSMSQWGR